MFLKRLLSLQVIAILIISSSISFAVSNEIYQATLQRFGVRAGVTPQVAESFFYNLTHKVSPPKNLDSSSCAVYFQDNQIGRDDFLKCLDNLSQGRAALNAKLNAVVFELKQTRYAETPSTENQKSILLLSWIEDLIRTHLGSELPHANWFVKGEGFVQSFKQGQKTIAAQNYYDFDFQDGDVLLSFGVGSPISAFISQSTDPQRRISHAFIVHLLPSSGQSQEPNLVTFESVIEHGVISNSAKEFMKHGYQQIVVMRWKDEKTRAQIAPLATEFAKQTLGFAYNFSMDIFQDARQTKKMFCSQLVGWSYAQAASQILHQNITTSDFIPNLSHVRSGTLLKFLNTLGVKSLVMPSPGDLLSSPYLKIVADFRDTTHLYKNWESLLMADVFINRIEGGYRPVGTWELQKLKEWATPIIKSKAVADLANEMRLPIDFKTLSVETAFQTGILMPAIYKNAYKYADDALKGAKIELNLLTASPWHISALLEEAAERDKNFQR